MLEAVGWTRLLGAEDGRDTVLARLLHGPGASLGLGPRTSVTSRSARWLPPCPAPQAPPPLLLQLLLQLSEEAPVGALGDDLLGGALDHPGLVQA
jgi:hypothetical protein